MIRRGPAARTGFTLIEVVAALLSRKCDGRPVKYIEDRMEYLLNRERVRHGLRRLRNNHKMRYWATNHAQHMATR